MPDVIEDRGPSRRAPQTVQCPRCGQEVRAGMHWQNHINLHRRADVAQAEQGERPAMPLRRLEAATRARRERLGLALGRRS